MDLESSVMFGLSCLFSLKSLIICSLILLISMCTCLNQHLISISYSRPWSSSPLGLINPRGLDEQGREYEMEVRWWFKQVPMEIRRMSEQIINDFKQQQNDAAAKSNN
jgi:hypothetical protein